MRIELGERSYDIVIDKGVLNKLNGLFDLNRKVMVVTDDGIPSKYVKSVLSQCKNGYLVTIPQGESSKNLTNYEKIISSLVENDFSRNDAIIALGGGMITDIAGFAASSYMRGVDFYNCPTTLLAQVDASIGGKVAVNFKGYKNLVGAFYQPKKVVIDIDTLTTLDSRLFNEGLAEAIKMGATNSLALFELIEKSENIRDDIEHVIIMALNIKKGIVENDERETWLRQTLNYGHTIGHAIENLSKGKLYHGECVAIGMPYLTNPECVERLKDVLKKYKLPVSDDYSVDEIMDAVKHDKKVKDDDINVCYVDEIGKNKLKRLSLKELKEMVEDYKAL